MTERREALLTFAVLLICVLAVLYGPALVWMGR